MSSGGVSADPVGEFLDRLDAAVAAEAPFEVLERADQITAVERFARITRKLYSRGLGLVQVLDSSGAARQVGAASVKDSENSFRTTPAGPGRCRTLSVGFWV
jgi:hypothetical protein